MARITFSTPAGSFSTGLLDVARMFLRNPGIFGHSYGAALDESIDQSQVPRLVQCIEQAVARVNGRHEEVLTGMTELLVHVEPMFHRDSWRSR
jgi:hypothetical protein